MMLVTDITGMPIRVGDTVRWYDACRGEEWGDDEDDARLVLLHPGVILPGCCDTDDVPYLVLDLVHGLPGEAYRVQLARHGSLPWWFLVDEADDDGQTPMGGLLLLDGGGEPG